jgi:hypothetical protein
MLFKTRSAAVYGIEAYLVDVEVNISTAAKTDSKTGKGHRPVNTSELQF